MGCPKMTLVMDPAVVLNGKRERLPNRNLDRRGYTPTGCLLPTGTGVSQLKRSFFSPWTMAKNSL